MIADPSQGAVARLPLLDALALGPTVWDGLLARTGVASPFMSWAWHRAWADTAPPAAVDASQAVLLYGPGGVVEALLPVAVQRVVFRRAPIVALTWAIGDLACPDHLDVPAAGQADFDAVVPALETFPWQAMILSNLAAGSHNATRLGAALARQGYVVRHRALCTCPYLELPGTWDEFLASRGPASRRPFRKRERILRRDHALQLTDFEADRVDEGWRHLVELHEHQWAGAGAFSDPRVEAMHRRFAGALAERGQLWLSTLDLEGKPAAAWYGFTDRDTVYGYQSGRDPKWNHMGIGQILTGMMIRRAIERGYRRYDFLRGAEPYKLDWTSKCRTTSELVVFRRGWRSWWLRGLDWAGRLRAAGRRHPGDA